MPLSVSYHSDPMSCTRKRVYDADFWKSICLAPLEIAVMKKKKKVMRFLFESIYDQPSIFQEFSSAYYPITHGNSLKLEQLLVLGHHMGHATFPSYCFCFAASEYRFCLIRCVIERHKQAINVGDDCGLATFINSIPFDKLVSDPTPDIYYSIYKH